MLYMSLTKRTRAGRFRALCVHHALRRGPASPMTSSARLRRCLLRPLCKSRWRRAWRVHSPSDAALKFNARRAGGRVLGPDEIIPQPDEVITAGGVILNQLGVREDSRLRRQGGVNEIIRAITPDHATLINRQFRVRAQ